MVVARKLSGVLCFGCDTSDIGLYAAPAEAHISAATGVDDDLLGVPAALLVWLALPLLLLLALLSVESDLHDDDDEDVLTDNTCLETERTWMDGNDDEILRVLSPVDDEPDDGGVCESIIIIDELKLLLLLPLPLASNPGFGATFMATV